MDAITKANTLNKLTVLYASRETLGALFIHGAVTKEQYDLVCGEYLGFRSALMAMDFEWDEISKATNYDISVKRG